MSMPLGHTYTQRPYRDRERTIASRIATRIAQPIEDVLAQRAAGNVWCGECQRWLAADDFYVNEGRTTGRAQYCKLCSAAKSLARYHAVKESERRTCVSCGEEKPILAFGRDRFRKDGVSRACRTCNTLRVKQNTERREKAREARTNVVRESKGSGGSRCECGAAGTFVLAAGGRACARCLKARVKERKSEQRSENA